VIPFTGNGRLDSNHLLQWARTPPSASWRFDSGRDRPSRRSERSPRRSGRSMSPRRDRSPYNSRRDDDRRDRDFERRNRSRTPTDRDDAKKDRDDDREDYRERDAAPNGDDRKGKSLSLSPTILATVHVSMMRMASQDMQELDLNIP